MAEGIAYVGAALVAALICHRKHGPPQERPLHIFYRLFCCMLLQIPATAGVFLTRHYSGPAGQAG